MAITPNSVVRFLNVPIENNYKNQIYFENRSDQSHYMMMHTANTPLGEALIFSMLTYVRKDNVIRVPKHIDELINANYVMYQNTDYNNRWFYAFITKMEYINDGRTDVYIETDVWQTWFDKINLKESFVEREHVLDDRVGLHTVDENLNIGDLVSDHQENLAYLHNEDGKYWLVIASTFDPASGKDYSGLGYYMGYPQSVPWFCFLIDPTDLENTSIKQASEWIQDVVSKGRAGDINSIFAVPYALIDEEDVGSDGYGYILKLNMVKGHFRRTLEFDKREFRDFNDFTPKNNKLYCYPYSFARVTNNVGSYNDYKIEEFSRESIPNIDTEADDSLMQFIVSVLPCQNVSGRCIPYNYQGIILNEDESVPLGKYPTFSWTSDSYTNWIVQNSVNIRKDFLMNNVSVIGHTATLNVKGLISDTENMMSMYGELDRQSMQPNMVGGNANSGDVAFADNILSFKLLHMRPKVEFLKKIDDFFEMYGYKINEVKIPNISGRPCWNYVRTVGVNIDGTAPQEDLTKIREMFDKGVTFWKSTATVEDYSQNNH